MSEEIESSDPSDATARTLVVRTPEGEWIELRDDVIAANKMTDDDVEVYLREAVAANPVPDVVPFGMGMPGMPSPMAIPGSMIRVTPQPTQMVRASPTQMVRAAPMGMMPMRMDVQGFGMGMPAMPSPMAIPGSMIRVTPQPTQMVRASPTQMVRAAPMGMMPMRMDVQGFNMGMPGMAPAMPMAGDMVRAAPTSMVRASPTQMVRAAPMGMMPMGGQVIMGSWRR